LAPGNKEDRQISVLSQSDKTEQSHNLRPDKLDHRIQQRTPRTPKQSTYALEDQRRMSPTVTMGPNREGDTQISVLTQIDSTEQWHNIGSKTSDHSGPHASQKMNEAANLLAETSNRKHQIGMRPNIV